MPSSRGSSQLRGQTRVWQCPALVGVHQHQVGGIYIYIYISMRMSGECMLLGSVSSQQRFGVMDIKALSVSQLLGLGQTMLWLSGLERTVLQLLDKSVSQLRVTALFYLDNSRKIHPQGVRAHGPKDTKRMPQHMGERMREHLGLPFICFFLPLGLPYVNWVSQECCLFYLKSSVRSSDLSLTFLCSIFAGFSLPCLLITAILDSCFLF